MASILIVDDHIETCRVMAMLVRHLGHEAHSLFAGSAVAPFLAEHKVDLIILDIMMPGTSGMDVLRLLRSGAGSVGTPIIMMTAITDPLTRREALEAGANDYWVKASIDVAELERRIAKHVRPDAGPTSAKRLREAVPPRRPLADTVINLFRPTLLTHLSSMTAT